MREPKRHVIVDGVELERVVHFPRILACVLHALQPRRLALGLLLVVAMMAFGRTWDAARGPRIHPDGLASGVVGELAREGYHAHLRNLALAYPVGGIPVTGATLAEMLEDDPRRVIDRVEAGYRERRAELAARVEAAADVTERARAERDLRESLVRYASLRSELRRRAPKGAFEATRLAALDGLRRIMSGLVRLDTSELAAGVGDLVVRLPLNAWRADKPFVVVFGLLGGAIAALCGAGIGRMSACQCAHGERLTLHAAAGHALGAWGRAFGALVLPVAVAAVLALVLAVGGAVLMLPWMDVVGGLLWGVALLVGLLLALVLVCTAAGGAMLVPAVACEGCDAVEATERCFSYVLGRPLHLAWYLLVGLVGLTLGVLLVGTLAWITLNLTASLAGLWTGSPVPDAAGGYVAFALSEHEMHLGGAAWHHRAAGRLVGFWQTLVVYVVGAYVWSYAFSAAAVIYLLMRRAVDGQDVEELWEPGLVPGTGVPGEG